MKLPALTESSFDPHQPEAALRRSQQLAALGHPNIPCGPVDGETLADIVDELAPDLLDRREVDALLRTVGCALAAAHDRGLSHGALDLGSIVITPSLEVRLTGFDRDAAGAHPDFDPAADVAALARIALELYTGLPPHTRLSRRARKQLPTWLRGELVAAASGRAPGSMRDFLGGLRLIPSRSGNDDEWRTRRGIGFPSRRSLLRGRVALIGIPAMLAIALNPFDLAPPVAPDIGEPPGSPGTPATALSLPQDDADVETEAPTTDVAATAAASGTDAAAPADAAAVHTPILRPTAPPVAARPIAYVPPAAEPGGTESGAGPEPALRFAHGGSTLSFRESDGTARLSLRATPGRAAMDFIWWAADGTARRESDYADLGVVSGKLSPDAAAEIVVPIVSDAFVESDEVFEVYASEVRNGRQVGVPVRTSIRIVDDD